MQNTATIPFDPECTQRKSEMVELPLQVDYACADTLSLVASEKFHQFFRVMNAERARTRKRRERADSSGYGSDSYLPIEPTELIYQRTREEVLAYWRNLEAQGHVRAIVEVNTLVERLAKELEEKEKLDQVHRPLVHLHEALRKIPKDQVGA